MIRRFLRPFVLYVTAVLGTIYLYIGARITSGAIGWMALGLPFFFVWLVPVVYWSSEREETAALALLFQRASFFSMGFLSFVLLFTLARDILFLPPRILGAARLQVLFTAAADRDLLLLAAATLAVGIARALAGPRIKTVAVPIAHLPAGLEGFRIAQISDLHIGPTIGKAYLERVVSRVERLDADLIALTGDIFDGSPSDLRSEIAPLGRLRARAQVMYVTGNHEFYWGGAAWIEQMRRFGATVLLNSSALIEHRGERILIGGVLDPAAMIESPGARPDLQAALSGGEGAKLKILLAHHPKIAFAAAEAGFDLQLSGHTHGGQFFPWIWIAKRVHRQLLGGLQKIGEMWVYISPGTGTWGPPVRLGTSAEITLLRLVPAK